MDEVLSQVKKLIERFDQNIEAYRSPSYNETQVRLEFINPLFEALGWDVTNKAKSLNDKTRLQREIDTTYRQIDQLVYELYGLTEKEIAIVGNGS